MATELQSMAVELLVDEEPMDMGSMVVSLRGDLLETLGGIEACGEIESGKRKEGCCCAQLLLYNSLSYTSFLFHIGKFRTNI
jgi:hypothetical protein